MVLWAEATSVRRYGRSTADVGATDLTGFTRSWPSLADLPALYPDARNRINRGPLIYRRGQTRPLGGQPDTAGRIPLLAVGSNAYPRQLADKLAGSDADLEGVPLLPAILRGYDAAWCPIVGRKGYTPLTLAARPGAVCLTWLQWLTVEQLQIISETEGPRYALTGGAELADAVRIADQMRRPPVLFAWWFDSYLVESGGAAWFDVYRRRSAATLDVSTSHPNPIPPGWTALPRGAALARIVDNIAWNM